MAPILLLLIVGGGIGLAFASSKKRPSNSSPTPGTPQAPGAPPLPGVPPQAPGTPGYGTIPWIPRAPLGTQLGRQPAVPARAALAGLRAAADVRLLSAAKRAVVATVGPDCLDLITLLQRWGEFCRGRIDGSWGDDVFRVCGFVHQLVGISLFPELWDAWAYQGIAQSLADTDPNNDFSAEGHPHAILWPQARPVSWDQDPAAFAAQIGMCLKNLRTVVYANTAQLGWDMPKPIGPWDPPNATPPPLSAPQAQAQSQIEHSALESVFGRDASKGWYALPIIGWALMIGDALANIFEMIFGDASGVQTIFATPLASGELQKWDFYMGAVQLLLRKLYQDCTGRTADTKADGAPTESVRAPWIERSSTRRPTATSLPRSPRGPTQ